MIIKEEGTKIKVMLFQTTKFRKCDEEEPIFIRGDWGNSRSTGVLHLQQPLQEYLDRETALKALERCRKADAGTAWRAFFSQ